MKIENNGDFISTINFILEFVDLRYDKDLKYFLQNISMIVRNNIHLKDIEEIYKMKNSSLKNELDKYFKYLKDIENNYISEIRIYRNKNLLAILNYFKKYLENLIERRKNNIQDNNECILKIKELQNKFKDGEDGEYDNNNVYRFYEHLILILEDIKKLDEIEKIYKSGKTTLKKFLQQYLDNLNYEIMWYRDNKNSFNQLDKNIKILNYFKKYLKGKKIWK